MPFIAVCYKSSRTFILHFQRTQQEGPPDHDKLYRFNVSGYIIETYLDTFDRFPNSLLGDHCRRRMLWDDTRKEFFLDRHRPTFESVYQFYQTGFLRRPDNAPLATFLEELHKYEFEEEIIKAYKHKEGIIMEKTNYFTRWYPKEKNLGVVGTPGVVYFGESNSRFLPACDNSINCQFVH